MTEQKLMFADHPTFDGETVDPCDQQRLETALGKVWSLMGDGERRTLGQIAEAVGCSESGAGARLRDLRKDKFRAIYPNGGVHRERVEGGLWVYWMTR